MARKINVKLIDRLTKGDLLNMLNYLKKEKDKLRLEVRQNGKAFVYFKKCRILDLGLNSYSIDEKYFINTNPPTNIKDMIINNPEQYFEETISIVSDWLIIHKKLEFETQQNIAIVNQDSDDKYIILDMEYNFPQNEIEKGNRVKKAGFDLLGIERNTGKVIFFEVKKGLSALSGKAGIKDHIVDFEECLYGKHKDKFREILINDIKNIVGDKSKLGLIDFSIPQDLNAKDIDLVFVFEPWKCEASDYSKIFISELQKSKSTRTYSTLFVSEDNYKLK